MVGREAEIERLGRLLEGGPAPAIALVGGEAGVGKTRLVRELIARLPEGTAVHAGQALTSGSRSLATGASRPRSVCESARRSSAT